MATRAECTAFLQWCLPRLDMRWSGFRKVRGQVCKRLQRRYRQLGLESFDQYRHYLDSDDAEWRRIDGLCRITISRFYRDREVFEALCHEVIPDLAQHAVAEGRSTLSAWSCGCASGEEPYTLAMAWTFELSDRFPTVEFDITATDADPDLLERARRARYPPASLRDLPETWRRLGSIEVGEELRLVPEVRREVRWRCEDVRTTRPDAVFDIVLCRNLVFTYYVDHLQRRILSQLARAIRPGGALVVGCHESLPETSIPFERWQSARNIFRRVSR